MFIDKLLDNWDNFLKEYGEEPFKTNSIGVLRIC
jgi:hypothetical protein